MARFSSASGNGRSPRVSASQVATSARLLGLGRDGAPGAVELLGAAPDGERLQRMDAEAARVRSERGERRRAAHVGDPGAGGDVRRRLADRPVRHAEEHELGVALVEGEPALEQARSDG